MIVTFYSYKGGSGRTLALANIAVLLARRHRVLAVDFDLEAPGLTTFLEKAEGRTDLRQRPGILELFAQVGADGEAPDWRDYVTPVMEAERGSLSMITSGRRDDTYASRVLSFDWTSFFADQAGGSYIESMRTEWREEFDFILVDSRTGITDTGGVCTIQLPDVIVAVFTASEESLRGIVDVLNRAQEARRRFARDRPPATILPMPSRFEGQTEKELAADWLRRFEEAFRPFYESWVPERLPLRQLLERTALPYVPYFSYGEQLPVLTEGTTAPASLGFALETVARLLESEFDKVDELILGPVVASGETERIQALVRTTQGLIESSDIDESVRRLVWSVLLRMVRPDPEQPDRLIAGDPIELAELENTELSELLTKLPVLRARGRLLEWREPAAASSWPGLEDRWFADADFLRWVGEIRRKAAGMEGPLDGVSLLRAIAWRDRHDDLLASEVRYIAFSLVAARREPSSTLGRMPPSVAAVLAVFSAVGIAAVLTVTPYDDHLLPVQLATALGGGALVVVSVVRLLDVVRGRLDRQVVVRSEVSRGLLTSLRVEVVRQLVLIGYDVISASDDSAHLRRVSQRSAGAKDSTLPTDVVVVSHVERERETILLSAPDGVIRRLARIRSLRSELHWRRVRLDGRPRSEPELR